APRALRRSVDPRRRRPLDLGDRPRRPSRRARGRRAAGRPRALRSGRRTRRLAYPSPAEVPDRPVVDVEVARRHSQGSRNEPHVLGLDVLERLAHMRRQFETAATAERVSERLLQIAARALPPFGQTVDLILRHHSSPLSLVSREQKKRPAEAGLSTANGCAWSG